MPLSGPSQWLCPGPLALARPEKHPTPNSPVGHSEPQIENCRRNPNLCPETACCFLRMGQGGKGDTRNRTVWFGVMRKIRAHQHLSVQRQIKQLPSREKFTGKSLPKKRYFLLRGGPVSQGFPTGDAELRDSRQLLMAGSRSCPRTGVSPSQADYSDTESRFVPRDKLSTGSWVPCLRAGA